MIDEAAYVRAYSRALFGVARVTAAFPVIERDFSAILDELVKSPELRRWIARRGLSTPVRRTQEVRQRFGALVTPATLRLLERMATWNQLHLIPSVAKRFNELVRAANGERTARVSSAQTPDAETLNQIKTRFALPNTTLDLDVRLDPQLLAGFTVRMDDHVFDLSLAGRLARLRRALTRPGRAISSSAHA